jgi:O-succinylbenzoic acid--CoA ligase
MLLRCYRDGTDPKDRDGWLPTGDLGRLDDDGQLCVYGRATDLIITGGENVWPAAVEAVLVEDADVAEVAVVGRPDEEWGQRVAALIVPVAADRLPPVARLRARVREQIGPWAAPKDVEFVVALPRTALGKIRRDVVQTDTEHQT